jgi:hypothetical protein
MKLLQIYIKSGRPYFRDDKESLRLITLADGQLSDDWTKMENTVPVKNNRSSHLVIRIGVMASLIFASQTVSSTPGAEASTLADVYEVVSITIAFGLGERVCGIPCGAAATAVTVVVNENAHRAAEALFMVLQRHD